MVELLVFKVLSSELVGSFQVQPLTFIINIDDGLDGFRLDLAVLADEENRGGVLELIAVVRIREDRNDVALRFLDSVKHGLMRPNDHGHVVLLHELIHAHLPEP